MRKPRTFISFDFDHDEDLKNLLVGQSRNPDTPFELTDWSVKEPVAGDWVSKIRTRIKRCEIVIVICGEYTHTATGVAKELEIAKSERIAYFLLWGRSGKTCVKPTTASHGDKIYNWTWDNLKALIAGAR